ncbi:MAG: methylated-DNA--[protein]-cysteine S-methyltransferase [Niastella sp.]|nr:methylated-DNA--[protein]-cysteine S-methyltransferase [Niastella sp.]
MDLYTYWYQSPIGVMEIKSKDGYIVAAGFMREDFQISNNRNITDTVLNSCIQQLDQYFSGKELHFKLPLQQDGTPFQQSVWNALLKINPGETNSYLQLSKNLGNPKAIRAVGTANGANAIAIIVPCHRVIGSQGKLVGYGGGLWRKKWLLDHEAKYCHGVQELF